MDLSWTVDRAGDASLVRCRIRNGEGVPRRVTVRTGDWTWRAGERILQQDFEFVSARTLATETDSAPATPRRTESEGHS